ncbi:MAG: N-acetylglutamate synthase-like GNAT family acetyltransferase [Verrucomicrobiales bacterium]|jgi:N-acetylglutamate synthase-like GNAT family acetyltransferase
MTSLRKYIRRYRFGGELIDIERFRRPFPNLKIRRYSCEDIDRCSHIYRLNEEGRFPEGVLGHFQEALGQQEALYIVAELEGEVIGVGGIRIYDFSDEIQTACLSFGLIDPAFHGRGYGTALLAFRLSLLDASRPEWTVAMTSAGNGTEIFFKKLGFRAPPETCCGNGAQRKFPLARR